MDALPAAVEVFVLHGLARPAMAALSTLCEAPTDVCEL
jgi:hypothetical protein